jgi:hypothetical protein
MSEQPSFLSAEAAALLAEVSTVQSCLGCKYGYMDFRSNPDGAVSHWIMFRCLKKRHKERVWLHEAYKAMAEVLVSRAFYCPDYRRN